MNSKSHQERFGAFIMTMNRPEQLGRTIRLLFEQTKCPETILVVDNGDDPATPQLVSSFADPRLQYHHTGNNGGPAGAARIGLEILFYQGYDWVLWTDDDDPPVFRDTLERILEIVPLLGDDVGVVGAVGERFDRRRARIRRFKDAELKGVLEVDNIAGNMMPIVSRRVQDRAAMPDPGLFFGFEELDFCLSVRRAGLKLCVPGELLYRHRKAAGRLNLVRPGYIVKEKGRIWREYYSARNLLHILLRKESAYAGCLFHLCRSLGKSLYGFRFGCHYGRSNMFFLLSGLIDGMRGKLGRVVVPLAKKI